MNIITSKQFFERLIACIVRKLINDWRKPIPTQFVIIKRSWLSVQMVNQIKISCHWSVTCRNKSTNCNYCTVLVTNANWQKEHEVKTLAAVFKIGIKTCIFIIMVWRKEVEILPSFTAGTNSCNWPSITRLSSAKKKFMNYVDICLTPRSLL